MLFAIVDSVAGRRRGSSSIRPPVNIRYNMVLGWASRAVIEAAKVQGIIVTPSKKRFNVEVRPARRHDGRPVARNVREKSDGRLPWSRAWCTRWDGDDHHLIAPHTRASRTFSPA